MWNVAALVLQMDWRAGETDSKPSYRSVQTTAVEDVVGLLDGVMVMAERAHDPVYWKEPFEACRMEVVPL